ncbi:MAG TPA: Crp/Fnr family transcriptional regulator [Bryobacteraceae bacterium]|jgi:CRP-like cAMP-binding protein|nr:Crp/Fnr family transcriptional regulator [Bryobacteraceae bacterium]
MKPILDADLLLATISQEGTTVPYHKGQVLFSQGDPADAVFSIRKGKVKLTVLSKQNKEAVIAILTTGDFVGEACLVGQPTVRLSTASAMTDCSIVRLAKPAMMRLLREDNTFSGLVLSYVLSRNIRIEEDLVDQLFNSSEKRLARILLLLANFGKEGQPEAVIPEISQETLAGLVGTTRSRVSFFMNRFRKLGFIKYNGRIEVHSSLLNIILHD